MNIRRMRAFSLSAGIGVGLIMLGLNPSPSLASQKHHAHPLSVQPRSSGYGFAPAPLEDPEAFALRNAQRAWPNRPLCDDGGYRIRPCDLDGGRP